MSIAEDGVGQKDAAERVVRVDVVGDDGRDHYMFHCPGCRSVHRFSVPPWGFDGNMVEPTVDGSVLVHGVPAVRETGFEGLPTCHSFIRRGHIEFLADSTHSLAGLTVDLPRWADDMRDDRSMVP